MNTELHRRERGAGRRYIFFLLATPTACWNFWARDRTEPHCNNDPSCSKDSAGSLSRWAKRNFMKMFRFKASSLPSTLLGALFSIVFFFFLLGVLCSVVYLTFMVSMKENRWGHQGCEKWGSTSWVTPGLELGFQSWLLDARGLIMFPRHTSIPPCQPTCIGILS